MDEDNYWDERYAAEKEAAECYAEELREAYEKRLSIFMAAGQAMLDAGDGEDAILDAISELLPGWENIIRGIIDPEMQKRS